MIHFKSGVSIVGRLLLTLVGGATLGLLLAALGLLGLESLDLAASGTANGGIGAVIFSVTHLLEYAAIIGSMGLGFVLVACWIYRRPLRSFVTRQARFRWRHVVAGFVVLVLAQGLAIWVTPGFALSHSPAVGSPTALLRLAFCLAIVVIIVPIVLAEEVMFRGWLLQPFASAGRRRIAFAILSCVLFTAAHLDTDPHALLLRFISAVTYTWAVVRLLGVELALGAHLGKNTAVEWLLATQPDIDHTALIAFSVVAIMALVPVIEGLARHQRREAGALNRAALLR